MTPRIGIFYASLGTGHQTAAFALREWCRQLLPESETICRDVLDYAPKWVQKSTRASYLSMARKTPLTWTKLYNSSDRVTGSRFFSNFWSNLNRNISKSYIGALFKELDDFKPDLLFTTHFLGMSALLDKWEHRTPIYFVSADYLTHSMQRDPRYDGWFAASDEAVRQYRADGIPAPEVRVKNFGIPIAPEYTNPPTKAEARERLGFEGERTTVLLIGGDSGIPALATAAESLIDYPDWRIEIICNNNNKLMESLRDKYYPFKHIRVQGNVESRIDYYAACDAVAMAPNGSLCAEAAACGAAILLLDPLAGMERYNCDYILENGAGLRVYENRRLGERISDLLKDGETLGGIKECASEIGEPRAAGHIIERALDNLEKQRAAEEPTDDAAEGEKPVAGIII